MSNVARIVEGILGEGSDLDFQHATKGKNDATAVVKTYRALLAAGLKNAEKLEAALERNWKDLQKQASETERSSRMSKATSSDFEKATGGEFEPDYPGDDYGFSGVAHDLQRQLDPLKRVLVDLEDHANNQANF